MYQNTNIYIDTKSADIIIIGLGTSGSIIARRLHDSLPNLKILVLERGINRRNDPNVYNNSKAGFVAYNPNYSTVLNADNQNVKVTIASMYGGASSHNYGLVVHGSQTYYNKLGKIIGVSDFIPYFKKIESYKGTSENPYYRGYYGNLQVSPLPEKIDIINKIVPFSGLLISGNIGTVSKSINTFLNSGPLRASNSFSDIFTKVISNIKNIPIVVDYNTNIDLCTSATPQLFLDYITGLRCSTDVGYLPAGYIKIDNIGNGTTWNNKLQISPQSTVNKIHKDGVEWFDKNNNIKFTELTNNGKIILCSGSIYNPLILQKSGFTNPDIGKYLTTHYGCNIIISVKSDNNDFNFSTGPLAFLPRYDKTRDWQIITGGQELTNFKLLESVNINPINSGLKFFTILFWLLNPRSRGLITYDINNPMIPKIDLNFWSDGGLEDPNSDLSNVIDGINFINIIIKNMKKWYPTMNIVYPPQKVIDANDKNLLIPYIKNGISMTDHYSSTCSINKVVDANNFKLHNSKNIHIVDASVFPIISDGNTEFPVTVMSEIAADRIINDYFINI
jgi:choline dehydrogenase-like flavoprotein